MGLNLEAIGSGMSMKLLWTNPAPKNSFSGQTVQLPGLSGFDMAMIIAETSTDGGVLPAVIATKEFPTGKLSYYTNDAGSERSFEFDFESEQCEFKSITSGGSNVNGFRIPVKIYGIKL